MSDLTITLPDGSTRTLPKGATGVDLAADIGPGLAKAAIIAKVNGDSRDLDRPLPDGATVAIVTADSDEGLHTLRHSTAHVLAQAVLELWPGATYAIGPPTSTASTTTSSYPVVSHSVRTTWRPSRPGCA